jgi:hypothetical protein
MRGLQQLHLVPSLSLGGALVASALFASRVAGADEESVWRRACEAKTASGPRKDAIVACSEALERDRSGASVRGLVSALVDGPTRPTSAEVFEALSLTAKEHDNPLGQTTAAAAACDIAEKLGDGSMLQQCANELERVAPNDPATQHAKDAIDAQCPPWKFWSAWAAVISAVALTLADALRRSARRAPKRALAASVAAAMTIGLWTVPRIAEADEAAAAPHRSMSKWPIDTDHPELGIPSEKDRDAEPLEFGYWLQDIALKGEQASKSGDHAAAARLYVALGQAVPDRAVAFVKLCQEYEALGDLPKAINACGDALLRDGARVSDYGRFVHLMLAKPGPLAAKDVSALGAVLVHLREDPAGRDVVDDLECQVGARTSNVAQLNQCTTAMAARAPDDAKTLSYQWAFAVAQNRFDDARKIGERAKAAGVPPESVAAMDRATTSSENRRRWQMMLGATAIAFLFGAVGIIAGRLVRKRMSTQACELNEPVTTA